MLKAYCSCIYQYCSCTFPYSKIEHFGKLIWRKTLLLQKEKRQMVELADSFQRHTFVTLYIVSRWEKFLVYAARTKLK